MHETGMPPGGLDPKHGSANYVHGSNPPTPVLEIKFYWRTAMLVLFHVV